MGLYNGSDVQMLICSGGIIGDYFALSVAECFINDNGEIKLMHYFIRAAVVDLTQDEGISIEVDIIYTPRYHSFTAYSDLAVIKLKKKFNLRKNPNVSKLFLPYPNDNITEIEANVAGFGQTGKYFNNEQNTNISDFRLRYLFAKIPISQTCYKSFPFMDNESQICVVVKPDQKNLQWGVCRNDLGAPLVIKKKIVALVSRLRQDCDDTTEGCLYTKVSFFKSFIEKVFAGYPPVFTRTYYNPQRQM